MILITVFRQFSAVVVGTKRPHGADVATDRGRGRGPGTGGRGHHVH